MIKIAKKQLSKRPLLTCVLFFSCQGFFFYYSLKINEVFLKILIPSYLLVILSILFAYSKSKKKERDFQIQLEETQGNINLISEEIRKNKLSNQALSEQVKRYDSLENLIEKLNSTLSEEETANLLVSKSFELIAKKQGTGILYGLDTHNERLSIMATEREDPFEIIKSKQGDIFDSWVLKKNHPLIIEDVNNDFRFDPEKIMLEGERPFKSLISCPMLSGGRIVGVLRLDHANDNYFSSADLRLLRTIADLGAVAMENALLYNRTEELAIRDGLTNLYLRRYFMDRLATEIIRVNREKGELSLLMIDVDNFKKYNDKFGHVAGDIVLKTITGIMKDVFDTAGNITARYGGEEFIVLLPNTPKTKAKLLAEELRFKIEREQVVLRKKTSQVTVSIGVASFPQDAKLKDDLIQEVDNALYRAKSKGRNLVCLA